MRGAVPLRHRRHVGHGRGGRAQGDPAEPGADHGGIVIAAHDAEDNEDIDGHRDRELDQKDGEDGRRQID